MPPEFNTPTKVNEAARFQAWLEVRYAEASMLMRAALREAAEGNVDRAAALERAALTEWDTARGIEALTLAFGHA